MWKAMILAAAISATVGLAAETQAADPIKLRMAYTAPLTSATVKFGLGPWSEALNKDFGGLAEVEIVCCQRLASLHNTYDRLISGVFEIGWGGQGLYASKFPGSMVVSLPFLIEDAEIGAIAMWNLIETGVIADEYKEVHPLAVFPFPPNVLHLTRSVKVLDDLKGVKIGTLDKVAASVLTRLGASPVSVPTQENYQSINRGLIDGVSTPWSAMMQFKLHEVTNYHVDVSMGAASAYISMNKKVYDGLPTKVRTTLDKHTGLVFARHMGQAVNKSAATQFDAISKMSGHTVYRLPDDEKKRWNDRVAPVIDQWVKDTPNGAKILAAFKAELAKAKSFKK